MSEQLQAGDPGEDIVETVDKPREGSEAEAPLSPEDSALRMGWTPKEQFKGDPEKWIDAETFIKRGEEFLPFLKANNKRLERELEKANTKAASLEKSVAKAIEHMSRADQRAYEKARRDLEVELDAAATAGDADVVREITKDIVKLEKEIVSPKGAAPEKPDFLIAWEAENPWFGKDAAMTGATREIAQELADQGITGKAQVVEVTKRIRAEFPHKFENPRRREAAAVEGVGAGQRRTGKTYSDLPADARQMCDELVRDKILTKEKYVSEYFK